VGQKWPGSWNFVACGKAQVLNRVPTFRGQPARSLSRRAWHTQLRPVGQYGYVRWARQCCMVAHPWNTVIFASDILIFSLLVRRKFLRVLSWWVLASIWIFPFQFEQIIGLTQFNDKFTIRKRLHCQKKSEPLNYMLLLIYPEREFILVDSRVHCWCAFGLTVINHLLPHDMFTILMQCIQGRNQLIFSGGGRNNCNLVLYL